MKKNIGIIGWRGMVGSVLLKRLEVEKDYFNHNIYLFSTSQVGQAYNNFFLATNIILYDAYNIEYLCKMDIIVTCQGSIYSQKILPLLRLNNWFGYWVDAASEFRLNKDSFIVLDPINKHHIAQAIKHGIKNFIGGNCTVSLLLLAIHGLVKKNLIKWVSVMSYQSISGSGAGSLENLFKQIQYYFDYCKEDIINISYINKLTLDLQTQFFNPFLFNVFPWIDIKMSDGRTREEWKGEVELNKILNIKNNLKIDGICVRVPVLRAHSQGLHIGLVKKLPNFVIQKIIVNANPWIKFVDNVHEDTVSLLTPLNNTNTLNVAVGRLKKSQVLKNSINLFTVGDQLLWGAAEPLVRILKILLINSY